MNRIIAGVLVLGAVSLTASAASAQALSTGDSCAIGAGGNIEVHALIYGGSGGGAAVWESVPCRRAREFESLTTAAHLAHADGNEDAAMRYRAAADALLCSVDDMSGNPMCAGVPQAAAARAAPAVAQQARPTFQAPSQAAPPLVATVSSQQPVQIASIAPVVLPSSTGCQPDYPASWCGLNHPLGWTPWQK